MFFLCLDFRYFVVEFCNGICILYKITKIKAAHHINTSDNPRVKLVKTFQKQKEKNMQSMFVCANTFSGDLELECEFEENKTILKTDHRTMEFR